MSTPRLRSLLLAVAFGATLSGCTKVSTTSETSSAPNPAASGAAAASGAPGGPIDSTTVAPHPRHSYTIPHTLRYATAEDVAGLNPLLNQQTTLSMMASLTMAWLIRFDVKNQPVPELVTEVPTQQNGGVSKDGLSIKYHLRPGLKWSDGAPLTSEDVKWTALGAVLNPRNNVLGREGWNLITSIDTPDAQTAIFHLKKPYGSYIPTFFTTAGANPCVLPKHLLGNLPDINNAPYNGLPIGAGPYKYAVWARGDRIEMVPNANYWGPKPKLQKVIFKIVPDRNTVMTQLQTHELDLWYGVPGSFAERLKSAPGIALLKTPSFAFNHYDFNLRNPALADVNVRRALMLAIDRRTLRDKIGHGLGILQDAIFGPTHPMYDPKIGFTAFDLEKAKALLDQGGWKPGPDGIRTKNGVKLSFNWAASAGTPDADSQIELVRTWWKQIGVDFDVRHYTSSLLFGPFQSGGIVYTGKWDVVSYAWTLDANGDTSSLYSCTRFPPNGQNSMHWCDPQAQKAIEAFQSEYDLAKKKQLDATVQERLVDQVPTIVTTVRENVWGYNDDLTGFTPNSSTYFDNLTNTDI